ncbi:MAG TPA: cell division protein FtsH, partial [Oceanipulchritudo sp.]|nr:cell division protein FtsH [Oceanipulchritudo sp.]
PLHKVTIIPRGRALGLTMMLPKKDILGQSRKHLLNQVCCAMAGRIGEEIETKDFSNGASNDIKQATKIARHMVCDWGMSDLGPVAYGENQDQVFIGKEITRTQNFSESTAEKIDHAITSIINEQFARARKIIEEHREALRSIANALLEHETIEGKHVHEIIKFGEIRTAVETIKDKANSFDDDDVEDAVKPKKAEDGKKDGGELSPEASPAPA